MYKVWLKKRVEKNMIQANKMNYERSFSMEACEADFL